MKTRMLSAIYLGLVVLAHAHAHARPCDCRSRCESQSRLIERLVCVEKDVKQLQGCKDRLNELADDVRALEGRIRDLATGPPRLRITLNVFSGEPDPVWEIDPSDINYDVIANLVELHRQEPVLPLLGYRGFTVEKVDADRDYRGCEGCPYKVVGRFTDLTLERLLLDSAIIPSSLRVYLLDQLDNPFPDPGPRPPVPPLDIRPPPLNPPYNAALWNKGASKNLNNCYNYANNLKTNTFAQPGKGTGQEHISLLGIDVRDAAERDGLNIVDAACCPVPDAPPSIIHNLVALVIWPGMDFHWYRLDSNKLFSHKMGNSIPTMRDSFWAKITDPRTAGRGPYTDFICFMSTYPGTVMIL